MLTLPDGRILFATGDGLPFGLEGRAAAQDPASHLSKLLLIDPTTGSVEVAAMGVRNIQHLTFANDDGDDFVCFGDIGGVTAEELNCIGLEDLLNTDVIENFGWGRNPDGFAREGTCYISPGVAFGGGEPAVDGTAPVPEAGFIQPLAQYDRVDPFGGVAVTGPVVSSESFTTITSLFSDLSSGQPYAITDSLSSSNVIVKRVNLIDGDGNSVGTFQALADVPRGAARFFQFPNGVAGVQLEATGDIYELWQVASASPVDGEQQQSDSSGTASTVTVPIIVGAVVVVLLFATVVTVRARRATTVSPQKGDLELADVVAPDTITVAEF